MRYRVLVALTSASLLTIAAVLAVTFIVPAAGVSAAAQGRCQGLPHEAALKGFLVAAPAVGGERPVSLHASVVSEHLPKWHPAGERKAGGRVLTLGAR